MSLPQGAHALSSNPVRSLCGVCERLEIISLRGTGSPLVFSKEEHTCTESWGSLLCPLFLGSRFERYTARRPSFAKGLLARKCL